MNLDQPKPRALQAGRNDQAFHALLEQIRSLVQSSRKTAATTINSLQVSTRVEIGRLITEHEQQGTQWAEDLFKEPDVLEFLGIDEKAQYSASNLKTIINKLEHFLLALGKGFLFESRQKRLTFDDDYFFVDLVFYNRLLRCYVLIDLKIGRLTHQDLGQMQMYVNYFDRYVKTPDEHPTVGMILCKQKRTALVELTLPKDVNIHASQYQLYLPSKEDLKQCLLGWAREEDEQ